MHLLFCVHGVWNKSIMHKNPIYPIVCLLDIFILTWQYTLNLWNTLSEYYHLVGKMIQVEKLNKCLLCFCHITIQQSWFFTSNFPWTFPPLVSHLLISGIPLSKRSCSCYLSLLIWNFKRQSKYLAFRWATQFSP